MQWRRALGSPLPAVLLLVIRHWGQSRHIAQGPQGSKAREFRILGAGGTELEPATCGVGGQGSQSFAATLRFSDRQLVEFQQICVLGCLRQNARTAVTTAVKGRKRNRSSPQKMRLKWGRWDRNRTCNLRFWRSRRCVLYSLVQSHNDENSCAFMCIRSHSVPFRFIALLPFLLPEKVTTSPQYVHVKTPSCSVWSRLRCWYPGSFNDA